MGGNAEDRVRLFSVVTSEWTWSDGQKQEKYFNQSWGWLNTGVGCLEMLWSLRAWKCSKCNWAQSWTTCSSSPCFNQMAEFNSLQRCLPTSAVLWFCNTSIYLGLRLYAIILIVLINLGKKWAVQALWKTSIPLSNYLERIWESIFQVISILMLWQSSVNSAMLSSSCA